MNHSYLMQTNHKYNKAVTDGISCRKEASSYRAKYLALRKVVRELVKEKGIALSDNQKNLFGIKRG